MGNVAPKKGEVHRMVVELKGPVSQGKYAKYKRAVKKAAAKYGARAKKGTRHRAGR